MNSTPLSPQKVITRFAPSPTGFMTLGNYRTALWAYLFAKKHQGTLILRIEDTDRQRSELQYVEGLFQDLEAMGIAYDPSKVWYQSQRSEIYNTYCEKLMEKGLIYECFCTADELALERKIQLAQKTPPRYSGKCQHLSSTQKEQLRAKGLQSVLRFRVTEPKIVFEDMVLGEKVFYGQDIGDFVIRKSDGDPTFFFCNAIDDALTGVTHALRGEDHLTNTPRQLSLMDALSLPRPIYAHLPLILGSDHKPLSKRNGSVSIAHLLEQGYFPEAINNYCARLGHHMAQQELLSLEDLAQSFDIAHLSSSAAHFDVSQLLYWQKRAFDAQSLDSKIGLITHFAPQVQSREAFLELVQPHVTFGKDFIEWNSRLHEANTHLVEISSFPFGDYGWTQNLLSELKEHCGEPWSSWTARAAAQGIKGRNLFYPFRYILTGLSDGPKLEPLYQYINKDLIKTRLSSGISL